MAREVDPHLKRQRQLALDLLGFASNDVSVLTEKCIELQSETGNQLGAHPRGVRILGAVQSARAELSSAQGSLGAAISAARGIDITVAVPEEER